MSMSMVEQIPAEAYLRRRDIEFSVAPHTRTFTTIAEAIVLSIPTAEILKTVMLHLPDGYVIAVLRGSHRLDMRLLREAVGDHDVRLATEDEIAGLLPDLELGALPPLPGMLGMKGYVDPDVLELDVAAFASGGRHESLIVRPREMFWGEDVLIHPISHAEE